MARYRFYTAPGPRVICVSSYAGRKIRSVAIFDEVYKYDFEKGKALAKAHVDLEIVRRKLKRAESKLNKAQEAFDAAGQQVDIAQDHVDILIKDQFCAERNLDELLGQLEAK